MTGLGREMSTQVVGKSSKIAYDSHILSIYRD